jgi:hypothetical protein
MNEVKDLLNYLLTSFTLLLKIYNFWMNQLYCICICFDGVVITAQFTATFFRYLLCSPELGIIRTLICQINVAQRPIFSVLKFFI